MDKKSLNITKPVQFDKMIELLQKNPDLTKGQFGSSKKLQEEQWEKIAVEINSLGPPIRTTKEWQRVWIHFKANLKRKLANNKRNVKATGGGPSEELNLSHIEESVVGLINLQTAVNPLGKTLGLDDPEPSPLLQTEGEENLLNFW